MRKVLVYVWSMLALCGMAFAQRHTGTPATVPIVMLSDLHFDPYADPKKFDALRHSPASEWDAILRSPDTKTKDADFAALQQTCHARGVDTPMPLLTSSLKAQKDAMPDPLFVTVSGDLMAHVFDCKFKALARDASAAEYSEFAAKTIAFLAWELHHTFPKAPVYFSLGNNDSGCRDYREDENSAFLKADAKTFSAAVQNAKNGKAIEKTFPALGDYNVMLPRPMKTRLVVVQDMFASKGYARCGNEKESISAGKQSAWLRRQLMDARAKHQRVWVMGHIPPGVTPFGLSSMPPQVCSANNAPAEFLLNEDLLNDLTDYADVVKLAIFGHTHMDEIRLLRGKGGAIPLKIVPATTTIGGNMPAFTVAQVNPGRAIIMDYAVYNADNKTGVDATWSKEYDYQATYKLKDFSADSVQSLTDAFVADRKADIDAAKSYGRYYQTGSAQQAGPFGVHLGLRALHMLGLWHEYSCAADNGHAVAYKSCVCSEGAAK